MQGCVTPAFLMEFVALWSRVALAGPLSDGHNEFFWNLTESRKFTTASAYRLQFLGSTRSPALEIIWKVWAPAKIKLFAWLLSINRLLTVDRLLARQWPNNYFCPLCRRNLEISIHLFKDCQWSRQLWAAAAVRLAIPSLHPVSWPADGGFLVDWMMRLGGSATLIKRWMLPVSNQQQGQKILATCSEYQL